jgi:hypothetical protein
LPDLEDVNLAADSVVNSVEGVEDSGASFALIDPFGVAVEEGVDGAEGFDVAEDVVIAQDSSFDVGEHILSVVA